MRVLSRAEVLARRLKEPELQEMNVFDKPRAEPNLFGLYRSEKRCLKMDKKNSSSAAGGGRRREPPKKARLKPCVEAVCAIFFQKHSLFGTKPAEVGIERCGPPRGGGFGPPALRAGT